MPITFQRPRLLTFNDTAVSDHNRSPLGVDVERIETSHRMANGTMRKYWVADKRTFQVSWDMLPTVNTQTVDGFWGAASIESFYNNTPGAFTLKVFGRDGSVNTYTVMFTDFSKSVEKRWATMELWNVSVSMEEV